jgi:hypothetical protein
MILLVCILPISWAFGLPLYALGSRYWAFSSLRWAFFFTVILGVSTLYREHHFVLLISVVWAFYLCVGICVMGRLIDVGGRWAFYCVDLIQPLLISAS